MTTLTTHHSEATTAARTSAARGPVAPRATVVITSRNRVEELVNAVASALAQTVVSEVIVIDDASDDRSAEIVAERFPGVRVYRAPQPVGYITLRNLGNQLATNPYVVSIDDDAVFSRDDVVEESLTYFDNPRIGAVAIPFINVNTSPRQLQTPPDDRACYLTESYVGTAHVLRKSTFEELGAYRTEFVHQGEETDYCLRMAHAGLRVCLAKTAPILHYESPRRSFARMDFYGRRNDCLISLWNVPASFLPWQLLSSLTGGLWFGVRHGKIRVTLRGLFAGLYDGLRMIGRRKPVTSATYRQYKRMKRLRGQG